MNAEFQVLLAVLVYLCFFAWIGWRRGLKSELTVFIVAIVSWVILQERGSIFVRIANLGVKFLGLLGSSLATGTVDESTVTSGTDFVQPGSEDAFLFVLWIIVVMVTYVITTRPGFIKGSKHNAWAAITGALNGLFFLAVLIPKFNQLYDMIGNDSPDAPLQTFVGLISQFITFIINGIRSFWEWVQPLSPTTILIVLTIILALIAISLRRGSGKTTG
jgi:hypothetical protein